MRGSAGKGEIDKQLVDRVHIDGYSSTQCFMQSVRSVFGDVRITYALGDIARRNARRILK